MNFKLIAVPAAALLILGVVGYAATAQPGRGTPAEAQMPTINQGVAGGADDNSRECQPGVVDANCVYL